MVRFKYLIPERHNQNVANGQVTDDSTVDSLDAKNIPYIEILHIPNMESFDGAKYDEPGLAFKTAAWPWLSERQVDELITALLYWKQEHGNGTV